MRAQSGAGVLSRLLAVVVAVGLVMGALALRNRGGDGGPADRRGGGPGTLLCVTELEDVCDELAGDDLDVQVEDAGVTLDAIAAEEPPQADAWLTLRPWPQMARERRAGLLGEDTAALGHSPLVLAMWEDRAAALAGECDPVTWACIGEFAGDAWTDVGGQETWGPVKVGHAHPGGSAGGLLVLHQAVASRLRRADYDRSTFDQEGFFAWFDAFQRAAEQPPSGSPLEAMVQFGPARYDVVGSLDAEVEALRERAAQRTAGLQALQGDQPVAAEVVVVAVGAGNGVADQVAERVPALLEAHHWQRGAADRNAVPAPVALEALRALWMEVRG